jgi:hypothetical protein
MYMCVVDPHNAAIWMVYIAVHKVKQAACLPLGLGRPYAWPGTVDSITAMQDNSFTMAAYQLKVCKRTSAGKHVMCADATVSRVMVFYGFTSSVW